MALIKCVECGKEISDKAVACPHCGCPVFKQNENQTNAKEIFDETIFNNSEDFSSDNAVTPEQNTTGEVENINSTVPLQPNVKKKKLKGWHKALIGIASVVCIIGVLFVVLILIPAIKAVNSYNEIAPYLDYVGNSHSDVDEAITLTGEEYNNIDKVKLLGMEGEVSFQLRDGYISSCTWTSNDFCSEEKYRAFADDLYILFDSEPKVEDYSYGNGNTYRYYWTDSYYDLDVSMAHGFFAYDPDGKIEIKWEVPEDTIEEGISENEGEEGTLKDNIKMVETLFSLNYEEIFSEYPNAEINPLGDWTGGTDVDTGATNRKLGSDMADSVTGGGLHGKDLSKADVSVNIHAFLKAQLTGQPVQLCCAIGDSEIDGLPYSEIVAEAREYVQSLGGFEKLAEWGLF